MIIKKNNTTSFVCSSNCFISKNLRRMMQFAEQFPNQKIIVTMSRQLSWSHIIELLPLQTMEAKLFYANESIGQGLGFGSFAEQYQQKPSNEPKLLIPKLQRNQKSL